MRQRKPARLYLITPARIDDMASFAPLLERVLAAGGIDFVQLRLKRGGERAARGEVLAAARVLAPLTQAAGARFLLNDWPELAAEALADGVHIGQSDMAYKRARTLLGGGKIIGVTCHASLDLAKTAAADGADYVAFGAFYPTATKIPAARAGVEILGQWRGLSCVPSAAIGGVDPERAALLARAGADYLAVSSGIWNHKAGAVSAAARFREVLEGQKW